MLRYAHTISSASRRLASRHPMFCDPCTAGPRQFYPLRNNNFKANRWTKRINILSFTESWYICPSDGYLFAYTNDEGINSSAGIYLNDTYQKISISPNSFSCLFVKQGMKIKIEANDISKFINAFFCPFWD